MVPSNHLIIAFFVGVNDLNLIGVSICNRIDRSSSNLKDRDLESIHSIALLEFDMHAGHYLETDLYIMLFKNSLWAPVTQTGVPRMPVLVYHPKIMADTTTLASTEELLHNRSTPAVPLLHSNRP